MNKFGSTRREFIKATSVAALSSSWSLLPQESTAAAKPGGDHTCWILNTPECTFQERLAARELLRGLRKLGFAAEPKLALLNGVRPAPSDSVFTITVAPDEFKHREGYEIVADNNSTKDTGLRLKLTAASPQAALYAVFDFLQRQEVFFGLDGEIYPLELPSTLSIPVSGSPWRAQPRFNVRGLVPWPDFLNCITVFNPEDHRAYLEAMLRMRFNMFGVHVYSGPDQWAEPFLSFEYGGTGHLAYTDSTASNRWGYLPQKTSRFGMGAAQFYGSKVFGSDATRLARNPWEAAEMAQQLWRDSFSYAERLGIRTGVGFEPYKIPDEIFRAVPPEAHSTNTSPEDLGPRLDPESVAARNILEIRLGQLLETYPSVDTVWLWEDEGMNWASQRSNVTLSVTPFKQAHDFLRRHSPRKRLVLAGWGGVARHFESFHQRLPGDIIFSCLSDTLGWDPVHPVYGKLEGRERWPILWLEDDPSMWLPQFHVNRFQQDMKLADQYGCQGLLGIHWRHRIVDPTAGFQSRASWDKQLETVEYYKSFARSIARQPRSQRLAEILEETDRERRILCTFPKGAKKGEHHLEYAADYEEGFAFHKGYEPSPELLRSQKEVASVLTSLTASASSPAERERLIYFSKHVEFLIPYSEAWGLAVQLHKLLQQVSELKRTGKIEEACRRVEAEGVPLWISLAPKVREVMLDFQQIISTRHDLGSLASMQNKFVRLALFRLPASMKEFLGELPEGVRLTQAKASEPDPNDPPRVFIPTRPTLLLKGESVRISAVAPGAANLAGVTLFTRLSGSSKWKQAPMQLAGRRTFTGQLGPFEGTDFFVDFYVQAEFLGGESRQITAPLGGATVKLYADTLVAIL